MSATIFEFDEAKQAKVKADRARMHWNLLVDAKKQPIRVREAMLASVFDEVMGSLIFLDASMRPDATIAKYQMSVIKLIGGQLIPLIPLLEIKKDYDEHLEYLAYLKHIFYGVDKVVFDTYSETHLEWPSSRDLTVADLKEKLKTLTKDDVTKKRVSVLLSSDTSTELLNSKEFVEFFEPYTDQELLLRGKLGKIILDDVSIPVLTDGMRAEENKCLPLNSIFICSEFEANLRIRHNNTWDSLVFDVNGPVKGVDQYVHVG